MFKNGTFIISNMREIDLSKDIRAFVLLAYFGINLNCLFTGMCSNCSVYNCDSCKPETRTMLTNVMNNGSQATIGHYNQYLNNYDLVENDFSAANHQSDQLNWNNSQIIPHQVLNPTEMNNNSSSVLNNNNTFIDHSALGIKPSRSAPAENTLCGSNSNTSTANSSQINDVIVQEFYQFSPLSGDLFQPEEIFHLDQPINHQKGGPGHNQTTLLDLGSGTIQTKENGFPNTTQGVSEEFYQQLPKGHCQPPQTCSKLPECGQGISSTQFYHNQQYQLTPAINSGQLRNSSPYLVNCNSYPPKPTRRTSSSMPCASQFLSSCNENPSQFQNVHFQSQINYDELHRPYNFPEDQATVGVAYHQSATAYQTSNPPYSSYLSTDTVNLESNHQFSIPANQSH